MINNRFQYYKTHAAFQQQYVNGQIPASAIAFIEDSETIVTHGTEFGGGRILAEDTGETVSV